MKFLAQGLVVIVLFSCSGNKKEDFASEEVFSKTNLQKGVNVVIRSTALEKLAEKREEALRIGHHFKDKSDYVRVELIGSEGSSSVQIRLKGDELDHLKGEQWSFRIKSKKEHLAGHQKVSMQVPSTKNYIWEYLFQAWCKKEGIINLDYFFLPVSINDGLSTIYAFEATADNHSLIQAGRKVGPILRFDEDVYWEKMTAGKTQIDSICMLEAEILGYNDKWIRKSKERQSNFLLGRAKLDMYRKALLPAREVFDYELFAKYVAISEVLGSSHNLRWINLRLYFNVQTGKLEPIAFDCFDGDDPKNTVIWYKKPQKFEYLLHPLFEDLEFIKLVEHYLKVYTNTAYLNAFFNENRTAISNAIHLLKRDDSSFFFSKKLLMKRAKYLKGSLECRYEIMLLSSQ